jgi:hypothetical protein
MNKYELLRIIYAKYNELDAVKKHVNDQHAISVIEAKQDTLNDIEKILQSGLGGELLSEQ